MTDFEKARLDPTAVFRTPDEVLARKDFTRAQKITILRCWEYDAHEEEVAEEENMAPGGGRESILPRVIDALHRLDAGPDLRHGAPTKQ